MSLVKTQFLLGTYRGEPHSCNADATRQFPKKPKSPPVSMCFRKS